MLHIDANTLATAVFFITAIVVMGIGLEALSRWFTGRDKDVHV